MAGKNTAVFGIYPHYANVESGVDALKSAGFRSTDISVLFPENVGTKDFAHEKGTKAPEGATAGAGTGAIIGGGLGWLAGIGALAIPGLGPFIAAGPIVAALAGVGVGGAVGEVFAPPPRLMPYREEIAELIGYPLREPRRARVIGALQNAAHGGP